MCLKLLSYVPIFFIFVLHFAALHANNSNIANNLHKLLDQQYLVHVSQVMSENSAKKAGAVIIKERSISVPTKDMLQTRFTLHHSLGGVVPPERYLDPLTGKGNGFSNKELLCAFIDPWSEFRGEIIGGFIFDIMSIDSHVYRDKSIIIIPFKRKDEFMTKNPNFTGTAYYYDSDKEKIENKVNELIKILGNQKELIEYPVTPIEESLFAEKLKELFDEKKGYFYGLHSMTVFGTLEKFISLMRMISADNLKDPLIEKSQVDVIVPTISALRERVWPLLNSEKNQAMEFWEYDTAEKIAIFRAKYFEANQRGFLDNLPNTKVTLSVYDYLESLQIAQLFENVVNKLIAQEIPSGYELRAYALLLQIKKNLIDNTEETIKQLLNDAEKANLPDWIKKDFELRLRLSILEDTSEQNERIFAFLHSSLGKRFRMLLLPELACHNNNCIDVTFFDLVKFTFKSNLQYLEGISKLYDDRDVISYIFFDSIATFDGLKNINLNFPNINPKDFDTVNKIDNYYKENILANYDHVTVNIVRIIEQLMFRGLVKNYNEALGMLSHKIQANPNIKLIYEDEWPTILAKLEKTTLSFLKEKIISIIEEKHCEIEHEKNIERIRYICDEWLLVANLTSEAGLKDFREKYQEFISCKRKENIISDEYNEKLRYFLNNKIDELSNDDNRTPFASKRLRILKHLQKMFQ